MDFGAAWGDVNGDGHPDLFINNHHRWNQRMDGDTPQMSERHRFVTLYLNRGNGTFADITDANFGDTNYGDYWDYHGAAFADFDNDGDQDLLTLIGGGHGVGSDPMRHNTRLFVCDKGKLEDRAPALGVVYPLARGRDPLWFDFNRDGLLDFALGVIPRSIAPEAPATIFKQKADHTFENAGAITGFRLLDAPFLLYSDLSRDGRLDLIACPENTGHVSVYDVTTLPFTDITKKVLPEGLKPADDIVSADFNGDLQPDLFVSRGAGGQNSYPSDFFQDNSRRLSVRIVSFGPAEQGLQFHSAGALTFYVHRGGGYQDRAKDLPKVRLGAGGKNPVDVKFTLSPDDPELAGVYPHKAAEDAGVYINYDRDRKRWRMLVSKMYIVAIIEGAADIADVQPEGFGPDPKPAASQLLLNTPQGLVDKTAEAGIQDVLIRGAGVGIGDFDNDMDLDIYIVTSRSVVNTPNILLENQGNGRFIPNSDAGGAAGAEFGMGHFVAVADYDSDGWLDLFVGNGGRGVSSSLIAARGPYQLFHNESRKKGNGNHWLLLELQGTTSNRDGIGAQVFLTAGGVTQLREQSGGRHFYAQDHQRIHFGLGPNTLAQELLIEWPSGTQQRIRNVKADQLLQVVESDAP